MLLRPLLAVAGLSAAVNAFLVPPQLNAHEVDAFESIPVESAAIAQAQTVNLECPGCPPISQHKPKNHAKGKGEHHGPHTSHLELEFTTDAHRLMVNGFELYPNSDPFSNALLAPQVTEKVKGHHKFNHDGKPKTVQHQLGFSLQVQPIIQTADEGIELVVVDLQIIEVGSIFVDGLPNIRVHLIKAPTGELLIAKIVQQTTAKQTEQGQECTTLLCKWRAVIAASIQKMKTHGCAGMMGGKTGHAGPSAQHNHHHHQGHQGHQGHHASGAKGFHHRQHGWALLFRKLTSHILLPVLVGIVAGVSVSILGMVVGTVLVGLWRKVVRGQTFFPSHHCRRFGRSSCRKALHQEIALPEEKTGLMVESTDNLPPPPSYEDEPAEETSRV
ncbi:hypothetical protein BD289DRAFT_369412 [Coniella lustricola]|uniref:DUF7728 domain-containing protein n=1 Tax=Coniella lustricola TaxID=2025994 RepID=A0A2T3A6J7_9PEZI|nr:hypothetical protein BD289DRAFT_369412 [Coniella lustricola]